MAVKKGGGHVRGDGFGGSFRVADCQGLGIQHLPDHSIQYHEKGGVSVGIYHQSETTGGGHGVYELQPKTGWDIRYNVHGGVQRRFERRFLHTMSEILRGHVKCKFNRYFDDGLYVPVGRFILELAARMNQPPISFRTLIMILKSDDKNRFGVMVLRDHPAGEDHNMRDIPILIRTNQGHNSRCFPSQEAEFALARRIFVLRDISGLFPPNVPVTDEIYPRLYHRTTREAAMSIIQTGLYPGGAGQFASGRKHVYLSPTQPEKEGYVSGVRARSPIEICLDGLACLNARAILFETESNAVLTSWHLPNHCILWVVDTRNGATLWSAGASASMPRSIEQVQRLKERGMTAENPLIPKEVREIIAKEEGEIVTQTNLDPSHFISLSDEEDDELLAAQASSKEDASVAVEEATLRRKRSSLKRHPTSERMKHAPLCIATIVPRFQAR